METKKLTQEQIEKIRQSLRYGYSSASRGLRGIANKLLAHIDAENAEKSACPQS